MKIISFAILISHNYHFISPKKDRFMKSPVLSTISLSAAKLTFITLLTVMSLSVANAAPPGKPSSGQIKKLIKEMLIKSKTTSFVGISNVTYKTKKDIECENTTVKKIKILKIGRASSNYYKSSGNYINSNFKVKFLIQGSCNLSSTYRINAYEYQKYKNDLVESNRRSYRKKPTPLIPMDLSGRVPFRGNIPFEVYISTDDYGDWYANEPSSFKEEDRHYSDKTKKYLKDLFYRKHGASVKKWEKDQTLAASKMSYDAETGLSVIKYNRLYTAEVKALLLSQPKRIREYVFSRYWKLSRSRNHARSDKFLRDVIAQLKSKKVGSKAPKKSVNSASSLSHTHGGRSHAHKLPKQGKSHRHRNGPIGR